MKKITSDVVFILLFLMALISLCYFTYELFRQPPIIHYRQPDPVESIPIEKPERVPVGQILEEPVDLDDLMENFDQYG